MFNFFLTKKIICEFNSHQGIGVELFGNWSRLGRNTTLFKKKQL